MNVGKLQKRQWLRLAGNFFLAALVVACSGCLSLGGKTTYVQESAETSTRVDALENRVGSLEQAVFQAGKGR
jgi:hypothetical protein